MIPKALTYPLALVLFAAFLCGGCSRYMQKLDIGEEEYKPPQIHDGLPPEQARVVQAAGANGAELRAYLEFYEKDTAEARAAARVTAGLCLADAAEYSRDEFVANQDLAFAARAARPWGGMVPEDVFFDHLLAPRVGREAVSPWRAQLTPLLAEAARARTVARAVEAVRLRVREWAVFEPSPGFVSPPLAVVRWAAGNDRELAVLLACSLRCVGVPARLAGVGAGLVEYWDSGWKTVSALNVAGLPEDAVLRADGERDKRLRHWRGSALAWLASRRTLDCPRERMAEVLVDARGNWREAAAFLQAVPDWRSRAYCEYVRTLGHKELAVLDAEAALNNVRAVAVSGVPDPVRQKKRWARFVRRTLPDRIADEPPSSWRGEYAERFMGYAVMPPDQARAAVAAWVGSLSLTTDLPAGPVLTPLQILRSGRVTDERERDIAERAALRALRLE